MNKTSVLVSGACLFRENGLKRRWFIIKQSDENIWELPKVLVRKGESSVRAVLRMMGEKGGMTTRVLEEAGRAGGTTTVAGKNLPQHFIYYLMVLKSAPSEAIGFPRHAWMEYADVRRKLYSKRERAVLKEAKEELERWKKRHQKKR